MTTKRTKGTAQIGAVIDEKIKRQLRRYAKTRKETMRAILERALVREMAESPTPALFNGHAHP